jgi:TonB family protein
MEVTREKIIGFITSTAFCLLTVWLLLTIYLRTQVKTGEEGILVNFGTVDLSSGTVVANQSSRIVEQPQQKPIEDVKPEQTQQITPVPAQKASTTPATQPSVRPAQQQPVIKSDEPTVPIDDSRAKRLEQQRLEAERLKAQREEAAKAEAARQQQARAEAAAQAAAKAKAEQERLEREKINQLVSSAFDNPSATTSNRGTAQTGTTVQGNPQSQSSTGSPSGAGKSDVNLPGRELVGSLRRPVYSGSEEGRIVIDITVDPRGYVINAVIGKGTNIEDANLRKSAVEAAKQTRFNTITSGANQTGTITYRYSLR